MGSSRRRFWLTVVQGHSVKFKHDYLTSLPRALSAPSGQAADNLGGIVAILAQSPSVLPDLADANCDRPLSEFPV